MATTAGGLPYPIGTDRVMDGDNAIQALAQALDPPWTVLPLSAGMSALAGSLVPSYRLIGTAKVELKGTVSKSSAFANGDSPFTLPAAIRPTGLVRLPVAASRGATTTAATVWRLDLPTTGVASLQVDTTSPGTSIALDGTFYTLN